MQKSANQLRKRQTRRVRARQARRTTHTVHLASARSRGSTARRDRWSIWAVSFVDARWAEVHFSHLPAYVFLQRMDVDGYVLHILCKYSTHFSNSLEYCNLNINFIIILQIILRNFENCIQIQSNVDDFCRIGSLP